MITLTIAGLTCELAGKDDLAELFRKLAAKEREIATGGIIAKTQKEIRYHEGKASAFDTAAKMIASSDI